MADDPMSGQSIEDRAQDGDNQLEAFPRGSITGDAKITLRSLLKPGDNVEYTASMRSAEVPLRGGLVDPRSQGRALVTYESAKIETVPDREEGKLVGWKIRQTFRPTYVEPIGNMDADLIEHYFRQLLASSPQEGARLADRIGQLAGEALSTA